METLTVTQTRLARTEGTIITGVTPKSALAADTTSFLGVFLGRGTRKGIRKMPFMQPAHCIWKGKLGRGTFWIQKCPYDLNLKLEEGSCTS